MMSTEEWQTYLALQLSGPRGQASQRKPIEPPPWEAAHVYGAGGETPTVTSFRNLLEQRRSVRDLERPLGLAALLQLLSLVLKRPVSKPRARVYPTSGGCDELGMLVVAQRIEGISPAAYWATAATEGSLLAAAPLNTPWNHFERCNAPYLGFSPARPPSATLLILADWRTLSARYEHCVLASALWDCGGLLQTVSLAAAAIGIHACISACIQPVLVGEWLGLKPEEIGHVGTISLGGQAPGV